MKFAFRRNFNSIVPLSISNETINKIIRTKFIDSKENWTRYVLIALFSKLTNVIIFVTVYNISQSIPRAVITANICSSSLNIILNSLHFNRKIFPKGSSVLKHIFLVASTSIIDYLLIKMILSVFPFSDARIAKGVSIILLAPFSYIMNRHWVHKLERSICKKRIAIENEFFVLTLGALIARIKMNSIRPYTDGIDQNNQEYVNKFFEREFHEPTKLRKSLHKYFKRALDAEWSAHCVAAQIENSDLFKEINRTSISVAEVGAGYGRVLKLLENSQLKEKVNFLGLELSNDLIERKTCDTKLLSYNILNEPSVKSDIVFCWAVMMYFQDDQLKTALENFAKISNYIIIFELPNTVYRIRRVLKNMSLSDEAIIQIVPIWSL